MFEVKKLTIRVNAVLNQGHGRSNGGGAVDRTNVRNILELESARFASGPSLRGKSNTVKFHSWVAREY